MPDTAAIEGVADTLFGAIERGDTATVAGLWSDGVTVWHSGDRRDNDRGRALRVIYWFIGITTGRRQPRARRSRCGSAS